MSTELIEPVAEALFALPFVRGVATNVVREVLGMADATPATRREGGAGAAPP